SVAIGVFAFMWGALQYATSGGSPHQLEMGKTAMKASLIGVGAIVLAATLVGIVFSALGGGAAAAAGGDSSVAHAGASHTHEERTKVSGCHTGCHVDRRFHRCRAEDCTRDGRT